jgi:ribonuclease E
VNVIVVADEQLETPHLEIQRLRAAEIGDEPPPSYQRTTPTAPKPLPTMLRPSEEAEQPAVAGVVRATPAPERPEQTTSAASKKAAPMRSTAPASGGLFARFIGWFRGDTAAVPAATKAPAPRPQPARPAQGQRPAQPASRQTPAQQKRQDNAAPANAQQHEGRRENRQSEQRGQQGQKQKQQQPSPRGNRRNERPARAGAEQAAQTTESRPDTPPSRAVTDTAAKPLPVPAQQPLLPAANDSAADTSATVAVPQDAQTPADGDPTRDEMRARRRGRRGGRRRRKDGAGDAPANDLVIDIDDEDDTHDAQPVPAAAPEVMKSVEAPHPPSDTPAAPAHAATAMPASSSETTWEPAPLFTPMTTAAPLTDTAAPAATPSASAMNSEHAEAFIMVHPAPAHQSDSALDLPLTSSSSESAHDASAANHTEGDAKPADEAAKFG